MELNPSNSSSLDQLALNGLRTLLFNRNQIYAHTNSKQKAGDTDQVNDDVFAPFRAPLGSDLTDVHHRLWIVGVDVEDWSIDNSRYVCTVR